MTQKYNFRNKHVWFKYVYTVQEYLIGLVTLRGVFENDLISKRQKEIVLFTGNGILSRDSSKVLNQST